MPVDHFSNRQRYLCQGPQVLIVLAQVVLCLQYGIGVQVEVRLGWESCLPGSPGVRVAGSLPQQVQGRCHLCRQRTVCPQLPTPWQWKPWLGAFGSSTWGSCSMT